MIWIAVDPGVEFDRLRLVVPAEGVSGSYRGTPVVALAEIEVIARSTGTMRAGPFIRADADGNGIAQATDALALLQGLFEERPLPCEIASDADASDAIDISDAMLSAPIRLPVWRPSTMPRVWPMQ